MLVPLHLIEVVLLFSDDVDSPLCIKCAGIAFIDWKNFLENFCSCSPATLRSDSICSFSTCSFSTFCSNSSLCCLSYRITMDINNIILQNND